MPGGSARVANALSDQPRTLAQIARIAEVEPSLCRVALFRMMAKGRAERVNRGLYRRSDGPAVAHPSLGERVSALEKLVAELLEERARS